jgi:glycine/D-amino acid oxidase-like deaminating enzyme
MKENQDILSRATEALSKTLVPLGPDRQTVDATVAKLRAAGAVQPTAAGTGRIRILERIKAAKGPAKLAAAAVLLLATGYVTGRVAAPKPPDVQQLYSKLAPAIRQQLLGEMEQRQQLIAAATYSQIRNDISRQYRQDLNQFAAQTMAASTAVTNQLLEDLITSINAAQVQDRHWVAAALQQIESNRLQDRTQLGTGLVRLAVYTEDELQRTKNGIAQFLANTQPQDVTPNLQDTEK